MDRAALDLAIRKSGMTKRQFAKEIGFTESRLWRKLSGKASVTTDEASEIAYKLGLSMETAFNIFLKKK